jgi:flagellar motor switch protein FliM
VSDVLSQSEIDALLASLLGGSSSTSSNVDVVDSTDVVDHAAVVDNSNFETDQVDGFNNVDLNIKVVMETIQLSLGEFMNLEKGEILDTHKIYKNKVRVFVEDEHCFNGEVGLICNRKAVKILDCLEKDV